MGERADLFENKQEVTKGLRSEDGQSIICIIKRSHQWQQTEENVKEKEWEQADAQEAIISQERDDGLD